MENPEPRPDTRGSGSLYVNESALAHGSCMIGTGFWLRWPSLIRIRWARVCGTLQPLKTYLLLNHDATATKAG
ncbi:hypothetical protein GQ602_002643 [Ophiocordyceps camponoti-floridani]|uniref:Uncharacterized protein n=1 Tax=Ophiocordyceps camponoti-floridani TaxID=2030778 RepID=A0A8H4QAS2_9HYPO|nr:hypothetical protein GQ602_002643 [Ophiocordyceps camponoti-floridani]